MFVIRRPSPRRAPWSRRGRVCVRGREEPARAPADSVRSVSSSGYENDYHPEPLTVEVQIQVNQCRSAEEALRTLVV